MGLLDELLALERGFWDAAGRRDAYAEHLAPDAVHVLPGLGAAADVDQVLAGVGAAEPWSRVSIDAPLLVELGDGAAALVYTARAERPGHDMYVAALTSV